MNVLKVIITVLLTNAMAHASTTSNALVQDAMKNYVHKQVKTDGLLPIIHQGKVLQLKLLTSKKYPDGFHTSISQKGNLYASCADFIDPISGTKYDIDFLVKKTGRDFNVVQPVVHAVNGEKSPYDLSH